MNVKSTIDGAVCLRCRFRIFLGQQQHQSRVLVTKSASDRRCLATSPTPSFDAAADRHEDPGYGQDEAERKDVDGPAVKRVGFPRTKRRLANNRVLIEASRSLNSEMLGKPAYAIVMREGVFEKKTRPVHPESFDSEPTDVQALLEKHLEPVTREEARTNIDELKPKSDTALSAKEFVKIRNTLTAGFLSAQLQDYLEYSRGNEATGPSPSLPQFDWIKSITGWAPLGNSSDTFQQDDLALRGYIAESSTRKERLAVRIMRECWRLSIAELSAGLGETRVEIRDYEFALLMRGTQRFMHTLSRVYLDSNERLEAFQDQKTLRLVTTKPKADVLIKGLNDTLRRVQTATFPVGLVASEPLVDDVLETVGRLTNTHVRWSHTFQRLHITWVGFKGQARGGLTTLEDLRHVVFRLLLTAFGPQQATSTIDVTDVSDASRGRLVVVDSASKDKLSWRDRLRRWARHVLPLETVDATPIEASAVPKARIRLPLSNDIGLRPNDSTEAGINRVAGGNQLPARSVAWSNNLHLSTTTRFGHILHPYQPMASRKDLPALLIDNNRRIFSPVTPHPLHLSKLEEANSDKNKDCPPFFRTKSTILLRFWPSPFIDPKSPASAHTGSLRKTENRQHQVHWRTADRSPAPTLEVRLTTSDLQVDGVESVHAITQTHNSDLMLPGSPVDLRVTQTRYAALGAADAEQLRTWPPLADYLSRARLELDIGKLEMPPGQKFPIPRRFFSDHRSHHGKKGGELESIESTDTDEDNPEHTGVKADPDELVSTSYEFVGLELQRSVELPYEGYKLTYTSIEAGQGGGRRAEVSLESLLPDDTSGRGQVTSSVAEVGVGKRQEYLDICHKLATASDFWSGYSSS